MVPVLVHMLWRRRVGMAWWSLGIASMAALLALAYPPFKGNDELDRTFADLPDGLSSLLGLSGGNPLTSPIGFLNSQYFDNILPVMLLVFSIGQAAWTIAGDEATGGLELLLANPVGRVRVALARLGAVVIMLGILATAGALPLILLAGPTGLDDGLSVRHLVGATLGAALLTLVFASLAFAVGAATGSRTAAIATASTLAIAGYVLEGLAQQVDGLRSTRVVNPWHWMLSTDPLSRGLSYVTWVPPLVAAAVLVLVALPRLSRRDLG